MQTCRVLPTSLRTVTSLQIHRRYSEPVHTQNTSIAVSQLRLYAHQLRALWDKTSPYTEFTDTVAHLATRGLIALREHIYPPCNFEPPFTNNFTLNRNASRLNPLPHILQKTSLELSNTARLTSYPRQMHCLSPLPLLDHLSTGRALPSGISKP